MNKNFIRITDNKGVEHTFYNFTSLVEYIDSFTMSFLPDDFTYFIQEEQEIEEKMFQDKLEKIANEVLSEGNLVIKKN